jgi:hypothetical protein
MIEDRPIRGMKFVIAMIVLPKRPLASSSTPGLLINLNRHFEEISDAHTDSA